MLAGAGQSHNAMRLLMAALSSTFEVCAINRPGGGYSASFPEGLDFPGWADAITDAIESLSLSRPALYGINTGNKIGASIAARYPELISSLIVCGQSHTIIPDMTRRTELMRRIAGRRVLPDDGDAASQLRGRLGLWRELEMFWWGGDNGLDKLPDEELISRRLMIADVLLGNDSIRQLYEANFAYDLEADLRRIACPTLIVEIATPQEDQMVGRQGDALRQILQDATLATFEEAGGLGLTLENRAGELAAVISNFLQR